MTKTETHTNKTILRVLLAAAAVLILCGAAVGAVVGETDEICLDELDELAAVEPDADILTEPVETPQGEVAEDQYVTIEPNEVTLKRGDASSLKDLVFTVTKLDWIPIMLLAGSMSPVVTIESNPTGVFEQSAEQLKVTLTPIDNYSGSGTLQYLNGNMPEIKSTGTTTLTFTLTPSNKSLSPISGTMTLKVIGEVAENTTTGTKYFTVAGAIAEANDGDEIRMIDDSTEPVITVNKEVTLNLAGHVLKNPGSGSVITVASGGILNVKDTTSTGDPATTEHYFTYVKDGAWTYKSDTEPADKYKVFVLNGSGDDKFTREAADKAVDEAEEAGYSADSVYIKVTGGCITGGSATNGGGVYVQEGTFTMTGGNIVGNRAASSGGGVYVEGGTFTMTGGNIVGNMAASYGGGVEIGGGVENKSSSMRMSGSASIVGNIAMYGGGGVDLWGGSLAMSDNAKITGNTASYGGGVYVLSKLLAMSGNAKITGNTASYGGGVYVLSYSIESELSSGRVSNNTANNSSGVYAGSHMFEVKGAPVIRDNMMQDNVTANNVYLRSQNALKLTGHFYGEIYINDPFTAGDWFGAADEAFEGANHFILETGVGGKHYVGMLVLDTNELKWDPTPKTISQIHEPDIIKDGTIAISATSAAEGAEIRLTATPADGYKLKTGFPKVNGVSATPVEGEPNVYKFTMPEAEVTVTAEFGPISSSKPSKKSQGSSVWLTAEPTVTPTPTPAVTPTPDVPQVKPVTPTETPAKTPAPFLGVLAGLGAAAAVFGLRRK